MEHYQFFGIEPRDLYFASQINHTEYCMVTFQIDPKIKYRNCLYVCVCVFFATDDFNLTTKVVVV